MTSRSRIGDATLGSWRKRKDRESSDSLLAQSPAGSDPTGADPASSNRLLAGCLAHEFLTSGTLLGKRWEANGSESSEDGKSATALPMTESIRAKPPSLYAEVSYLLKADGVRIHGVVNPTQLGRWLQL